MIYLCNDFFFLWQLLAFHPCVGLLGFGYNVSWRISSFVTCIWGSVCLTCMLSSFPIMWKIFCYEIYRQVFYSMCAVPNFSVTPISLWVVSFCYLVDVESICLGFLLFKVFLNILMFIVLQIWQCPLTLVAPVTQMFSRIICLWVFCLASFHGKFSWWIFQSILRTALISSNFLCHFFKCIDKCVY